MKLPEDFWSRIEKAPASDRTLSATQAIRALRKDIESVAQLISTECGSNRVLVWRGQSDADYGVSSSLYRKALDVHSMNDLTERLLSNLEDEIIKFARDAGLGRGMKNLQLLRALQHYHLPTRLIDVSRDGLSAMWFAVNAKARKDGRLFLLAIPKDAVRADDPKLNMLPWVGIKPGNWTNKILLFDAPASNPRMAAQNGAFIVGGLARNYAGQQRLMKDRRGRWRYVPSEQIHEISQVFIKFPQLLTPRLITRWKPEETYGVTWRIPAGLKPSVLHVLARLRISESTMYPDFDEASLGIDKALSIS